MLQDFLRLAVHIPVDEASDISGPALTSATSIHEIMRVFHEFNFTGSVGTYKTVAEISSGIETFMPTEDSAPVQGVVGITFTVPSARIVAYIPARTPGQDADR